MSAAGTRPAPVALMLTREEAAAWLVRAERELRRAQLEHDGSDRAVVRYQAARSDAKNAERVVRAMLEADRAAA